jgi:hypothetical protein
MSAPPRLQLVRDDDRPVAAAPATPEGPPRTIPERPGVDRLRAAPELTRGRRQHAAALDVQALLGDSRGSRVMAPAHAGLEEACPRCGRDLVPLEALAATARRARVALERMRIALPDDVTRGVRELDTGLACHAGLCRSGGSA